MSHATQTAPSPNAYWVAPFLFLVNFIVYYVSTQPLMDDSDVPWHLATGRYLLETGGVPLKDPWSFAADKQWYLLSWIWNAVLGLCESAFGLLGVLMMVLAISAGIVSMLAAHLVHMRVHLSTVFFISMVAALCMLDFITARPHITGYALSFIFYLLLYHNRGAKRYGTLLLLPPLMLLWANMHGSFIAGFTVLGAYVIDAFVSKDYGWLKRLLVVSVACLLVAMINPYGLEVTIGALKTLAGSAKSHTIEWLPFNFTASTGISTWLVIFILSSNLRFAAVPVSDKLLAVAWLLACMMIMRNGPMFVLLSAPYVARCIDEATADLREVRKPSSFVTFMQAQKLRHLWAASLVFALLFAIGAAQLPHQDKIISESSDVSDAIDYAMEHYPKRKYVTDFNFGGQVIYHTYGDLAFMMDSRAGTVYSEDVITDYISFMYLEPDWQPKLRAYGVDAMMIGNHLRFAQAYENGEFHDDWKLVFAGRSANVYIARNHSTENSSH